MDANRFRLPSLSALKAFHAAARHGGSVSVAARELSVSPQAVGQHLRLLEESLQITLFEKRGGSINSTEAAVLLARHVDAGLEELSEGIRRVATLKAPGSDQPERLTLFRDPLPAAPAVLFSWAPDAVRPAHDNHGRDPGFQARRHRCGRAMGLRRLGQSGGDLAAQGSQGHLLHSGTGRPVGLAAGPDESASSAASAEKLFVARHSGIPRSSGSR